MIGTGIARFMTVRFWGSVEVYRLVALLLVLASPAVSFWLSTVERDRWILTLLLAQLLLAALTWAIGEGRARNIEGERLDSRQETLVALGDALDPVTIELAKLSALTKPERRQERSGLIRLILAAATGLGPEGSRPRACYFKLESGGPRRLSHETSIGRSVAAKAEFTAGTPAGDTALDMIDRGDDLFCDDVAESPPPGWVPSERGEYRTFISVTVGAGGEPHGMLTLDATKPGSLTTEDVQMLRVLGHVLGVVEVLCT